MLIRTYIKRKKNDEEYFTNKNHFSKSHSFLEKMPKTFYTLYCCLIYFNDLILRNIHSDFKQLTNIRSTVYLIIF